MEIKEQLILLFLGILGWLIHCLFKIDSLKGDYKAANLEFSWKKDYLYQDYAKIIIAFLAPFVWYFLFAEAVVAYPKLENFTRFSFFAFGLVGSYLIQLIRSKAKKVARTVVDMKTNISDSDEVQAIVGGKIEKEDAKKVVNTSPHTESE